MMFRTTAIALVSLTLTSASLYAADAGVLTCSSRKVKESFRHTGLAVVDMQMRGAAGDIALNEAIAKRINTELHVTEGMKAWHLTVVAAPATAGIVQNIVLMSGSTVVAPSLLFTAAVDGGMAGYATFSSPEAQALVQSGDFQVVAELQGGRRSCDVSQKDRVRLGL